MDNVELNRVCDIKNGFAFKSVDFQDFGTPLLRISNFNNGPVFLDEKTVFVDEKNLLEKKEFLVEKGDILIALSGATTGKYGIYLHDEPALLNQRIGLLKSGNSDSLYDKYFYYCLSLLQEEIFRKAGGAAQPNISTKAIGDLKIPFPPLPVQKRIAEILDLADAYRQKTKALIDKYDELAQSIFLEMFGDPVTNPKGWEIGSIRDVVREVKYGTSSKAAEDGEYPYLRMNNITYSGEMDYSNLKYITLPENDYLKYGTKKGDVLFNRTNSKELVGKTGIIQTEEKFILAGYLIRLRVSKDFSPYFLWAHLNSHWAKLTLLNMCKSIVGMANINAQEIQNMKIVLPPKEKQDKFELVITKLQSQKEIVKRELQKSDELFNSLLQKAFKGELVKEDELEFIKEKVSNA
jgi:type I restriction enzyme S subunit